MSDLLTVRDLSAGYGEARVLSGISFGVPSGSAMAILGRNGTGKTTLVNSIVGLTTRMGGSITLDGRDITALRAEQRAAAGIGWVPQERNIFRSLTVHENMTAVARPGPWDASRVYTMFPRLKERSANMGNQLSGGEQQMLAIGRALVLNPRVLLLDEPLEGLAPIIVDELLKALRTLASDGSLSLLLVEQKASKILGFTDSALILDRGAIVYSGSSRDLLADRQTLELHLGAVGKAAAAT